jgi:murein DD-endopeptidase MepM/ murein hydrolase activator NlpD
MKKHMRNILRIILSKLLQKLESSSSCEIDNKNLKNQTHTKQYSNNKNYKTNEPVYKTNKTIKDKLQVELNSDDEYLNKKTNNDKLHSQHVHYQNNDIYIDLDQRNRNQNAKFEEIHYDTLETNHTESKNRTRGPTPRKNRDTKSSSWLKAHVNIKQKTQDAIKNLRLIKQLSNKSNFIAKCKALWSLTSPQLLLFFKITKKHMNMSAMLFFASTCAMFQVQQNEYVNSNNFTNATNSQTGTQTENTPSNQYNSQEFSESSSLSQNTTRSFEETKTTNAQAVSTNTQETIELANTTYHTHNDASNSYKSDQTNDLYQSSSYLKSKTSVIARQALPNPKNDKIKTSECSHFFAKKSLQIHGQNKTVDALSSEIFQILTIVGKHNIKLAVIKTQLSRACKTFVQTGQSSNGYNVYFCKKCLLGFVFANNNINQHITFRANNKQPSIILTNFKKTCASYDIHSPMQKFYTTSKNKIVNAAVEKNILRVAKKVNPDKTISKLSYIVLSAVEPITGFTLGNEVISVVILYTDGNSNLYCYNNSAERGVFYTKAGKTISTGFSSPLRNYRVSGHYGSRFHPILKVFKMHHGIDLAAKQGTPVFSTAYGKVVKVCSSKTFGNCVYIQHLDRVVTVYAHLQKWAPQLQRGQRVDASTVIGFVGSTGRSTGPHLHFEVRQLGVSKKKSKARQKLSSLQSVNPADLVEFVKQKINHNKLAQSISLSKKAA